MNDLLVARPPHFCAVRAMNYRIARRQTRNALMAKSWEKEIIALFLDVITIEDTPKNNLFVPMSPYFDFTHRLTRKIKVNGRNLSTERTLKSLVARKFVQTILFLVIGPKIALIPLYI